jgi:hypothetical protein
MSVGFVVFGRVPRSSGQAFRYKSSARLHFVSARLWAFRCNPSRRQQRISALRMVWFNGSKHQF